MVVCRHPECDSDLKSERGRSIHESHLHGEVFHNREWDNKEYLVEKYVESGNTIKEIAVENDVPYNTVREAIIKHDIGIRHSNETRYFERRKVLRDSIEEIKSKYVDDGEPAYKIANEYNVDDATITRLLENYGVETRNISEQHRMNVPDERLLDKEWLQKQYRGKQRYTPELSEELGCCETAVYDWLLRHDIEIWDHGKTVRDRVLMTCEQCGSEKEVTPSVKKRRRFCSKGCRGQWMSECLSGENWPNYKGGHTSYGPNWKEQRQRRLEIDDYKCVVCKSTQEENIKKYGRELSVHHIIPKNDFVDGGELDYESANRIDNLVAICDSCHNKWEGIPVVPQ